MKYYIVYSNKNQRGIWVEESQVANTIKNDFKGHEGVGKVEITEEHYMHLINNVA